MTFPRILGIEAVGVVDDDPSGDLAPGKQVVTLMCGMGRVFDGGSGDLPPEVLQGYVGRLASGTAGLGPIRVHRFGGSRQAHLDLEHNRTFGKHVVLTQH